MIDPDGKAQRRRPLWHGFLEDRVPALAAEEVAFFRGKHVLITGAGGYLGSAVARRLAKADTARLTLLDSAEYGLYRLDQTLQQRRTKTSYTPLVGSVNDRALLRSLFAHAAPEIVIHAAACKHVPLMEGSPFAAAETNVLGTLALAEAAVAAGAERFLLLSTDKAVAPISVMGATKRLAEQLLLDRTQSELSGAEAVVLRLCNVLGSSGSVAPLFARQIRSSTPVTVTDRQATRIFLSTRDAVRLILRAVASPSRTGLWVAASGVSCRVEDLARFMIQKAARPATITYTGLRSADKLHEQMLGPDESGHRSELGLMEVQSQGSARLRDLVGDLQAAVETRDESKLFAALERAVPGYRRVGRAASASEAKA